MMVKEETIKLVVKTLLLTGIFAGLFIGANMVVFSEAARARTPAMMEAEEVDVQEAEEHEETLHDIHDGYLGENRLLTETADENHGREWSSFNVDRLVPMEDHFLTREEAEVVVAEVLYEQLGLEVDASEFTFGLLDHPSHQVEAMWITSTRHYDENGEVHDVAIHAVTGELIRFESLGVVTEFFETYTHNGIDFVVEEWGNPAEGPEYTRYMRDYMLSREEIVLLSADFIYEEFGVTMEGLRMQASLGFGTEMSHGTWNIHIMPVEYDVDEDGLQTTPAQWFYLFINATTGEIIHYQDFRGLDRNDIIIGAPEGVFE